MMSGDPSHQPELARQAALVQALSGAAGAAPSFQPWLEQTGARFERALAVYRANAGASAERALASTFPTVQALLGEENFAALARLFWQSAPPNKGDLAQWGQGLPDFLSANAQLQSEPYLPDCARLDWLLAQAESAADASLDAASLNALGEHEPEHLILRLMPSVHLLGSAYPVVKIWQAHQSTDDDAFAPVRAALAAGEDSRALVWRQGWRGMAVDMSAADGAFTQALQNQQNLALALTQAGPAFDFGAWLGRAVQDEILCSVAIVTP